MSAADTTPHGPADVPFEPLVERNAAITEPAWLRRLLIGLSIGILVVLLLLPLASVFAQALARGLGSYLHSFAGADTRAAIRLTLLTAAIAVPANTVFGLAAAWAITRFRFPGKNLLVSLVDLPLSVSPVVAGLVFVLIFGTRGWAGPWLRDHGVQVVFALPGIVLATIFVTFPFVARQLIPVMQTLGSDEEHAALTLGAGGWQVFWRVTLPNVKWALFNGVLLCTARAMGEFGAVSVVSGHIRGKTNTLPLQVEILYNDYDFTGAFAVASLLAGLSLVTLAVKTLLESRLGPGPAERVRR